MTESLSHVGESGQARMVDVSQKPLTERRATASARVTMSPSTLALALSGQGPKGAVIETARLAGIQGAKRTSDLIPLCHPLPLDAIDVKIAADGRDALRVEATVVTTWRTGVEMEALTAAAVCALTVYDMCKAIDRGMEICRIRLLEKSGGKSGHYMRIERRKR